MSLLFVRAAYRAPACLLAALLIQILSAAPASAIVCGSTDFSAFSDFTSPVYGLNPTGVISWAGSSAVAVGRYSLLTADHVGGSVGSKFTLNGVTYTATAVTTAPADPGSSSPVDLRMITVDHALPTYYDIRTAPITSGDDVVVLGYGNTGESHGSYFTASSGRGTLRWGTNQVYYPSLRQSVSGHSSVTFSMKFNDGATPLEAGFAAGDSGGGSFIQSPDGTWQLAGINAYVSTNGITGQFNQSYAISLADHMDWINALLNVQSVPEPTGAALLTILVGPMLAHRRTRGGRSSHRNSHCC